MAEQARTTTDALYQSLRSHLTAIESGEHHLFEAGDDIAALRNLRQTYQTIRQSIGDRWSVAYLSRLANTAETFTPDLRTEAMELGATWYECCTAREHRNDTAKAGLCERDASPMPYLLNLIANRHKRSIRSRSVTRQMARERAEVQAQQRRLQVEQLRQEQAEWLANCHNADCLDVLASMADGSVDLLWCDPPYSDYDKIKTGKNAGTFVSGRTTMFVEATANAARKEAEEITIRLMRESINKLSDHGVLVLFQAACAPDRPEVILAAREAGYGFCAPKYWRKPNPQPGNFKLPFTTQTERILIFARSRDAILDTGDSEQREDDLCIEMETPQREFHRRLRAGEEGLQPGQVHVWEKPIALCEYFLKKLTLPADHVFDAFGASASMVRACIKLDRRWTYCELHPTCYELGVANIARAMDEARSTEVA